MRRLIPLLGLAMVGTLSCLASEHPSIAGTPASQRSCRQTFTTGAASAPLLLSVLRLPEITALPWERFGAAEPDDDDKGCCHIGQGTAGETWRYETWKQCKADAKAVSDDSPGFDKGHDCPNK